MKKNPKKKCPTDNRIFPLTLTLTLTLTSYNVFIISFRIKGEFPTVTSSLPQSEGIIQKYPLARGDNLKLSPQAGG